MLYHILSVVQFFLFFFLLQIIIRVAPVLPNKMWYQNYTKKHRVGCTRGSLQPGPSITNRSRSVRLVIQGKGLNKPSEQAPKCFLVLLPYYLFIIFIFHAFLTIFTREKVVIMKLSVFNTDVYGRKQLLFYPLML